MAHPSDFGNLRSSAWYRLTPDSQGHYFDGTWSVMPSMHDTRRFFSSQVLPSGQVFIAGGEYGSGREDGETFNPLTNEWTYTPQFIVDFSDSISETLPNGDVLVGPAGPPVDYQTEIYEPVSNTWETGPVATGSQNEASWVKLPDNSILTVDKGSENSDRYIPTLNEWVADSTVPVALYDDTNELGPAFLLPNGNAFFIGASNHTAIYTPSGNTSPGSWVAGPPQPGGGGASDAPAAMLVTGNILCALGVPGSKTAATSFYEYKPAAVPQTTSNAYTAEPSPNGVSDTVDTDFITMLDLPDGTVLCAQFPNSPTQDTNVYDYAPSGSPVSNGIPAITSITQNPNQSYTLTGTLLNGISEGAAFGDDIQMATNRPIVALTSTSGNVYYARTYNWSSTGVMTGTTPETTNFTLPPGLPAGNYAAAVSANGITSGTVPLSVTTPSAPQVFNYHEYLVDKTPATLPVLTNAVDVADGPLTITSVTTPSLGSAAIAVSGTEVTYTPFQSFSNFPGVDSFRYTVTDAAGTTGTATVFVTNPFSTQRGNYTGTFNTGGGTLTYTGYITLALGGNGGFTGKVYSNGAVQKIKGTLAPDGTYTSTLPLTSTTSEPVYLQFDPMSTSGDEAQGQILVDVDLNAGAAFRSPWSPTYTAPEAGTYTMLMPAVSGSSTTVPTCTSFATLTVSPLGNVAITGVMADGKKFTAGAKLAAGPISGSVDVAPLFAVLRYGQPGSLIGALGFSDNPGVSDFNGPLQWTRPQQTVNPGPYTTAFVTQTGNRGSRYTPPAAGMLALDFPSGAGNALIQFSSPDFPMITGTATVTLDGPGKDKVTILGSAGTDSSMTINTKNGTFTGRFFDPSETAAVPFQGALFRKKDEAEGFFLDSFASGNVLLTAP